MRSLLHNSKTQYLFPPFSSVILFLSLSSPACLSVFLAIFPCNYNSFLCANNTSFLLAHFFLHSCFSSLLHVSHENPFSWNLNYCLTFPSNSVYSNLLSTSIWKFWVYILLTFNSREFFHWFSFRFYLDFFSVTLLLSSCFWSVHQQIK